MWEPDYASLAEMRNWLKIHDIEDTDGDELLRIKISASSRAVDGTAGNGRTFGQVDEPVTLKYNVRWSRSWGKYVCDINDIADTTDLTFTLDGVELTEDDYELQPLNAVTLRGRPYTYVLISATPTGPGRLHGLGKWGWGATWPDGVKEATMLQTSRLQIRPDSPYGVAGSPGQVGAELRLLSKLDPDIAPLIAPYVHPGWVAK